jgi:hypothetical protein
MGLQIPRGPLIDCTFESRTLRASIPWARGYAVSAVGFDLDQIFRSIRVQEEADGSEGRF